MKTKKAKHLILEVSFTHGTGSSKPESVWSKLCPNDIRNLKFIVCNHCAYKKCYEKFRTEKGDTAQNLLEAAKFNQYSVFDRIADLRDVSALCAADALLA